MSVTPKSCRASILVKALPRPSKAYSETVCCAGVTAHGEFKRLYPVRFRHLSSESAFKRWDWVKFKYRDPRRDHRPESCHVAEESIEVDGVLPSRARANLLVPLISGSGDDLARQGRSLGLIRPRNTRFFFRRKRPQDIEEEREAYRQVGKQQSLFDQELAAFEPNPIEFKFRFEDDAGQHEYVNADWEAHAMYYNGLRREGSEAKVLDWMSGVFNDEYPRRGMLFAVGNMAKRPQTWQLLGVLRVDNLDQQSLF